MPLEAANNVNKQVGPPHKVQSIDITVLPRIDLARHGASEHDSQWAAIVSVSPKVGCVPETLRKWVRQAEREQAPRYPPPAHRRPGLVESPRPWTARG